MTSEPLSSVERVRDDLRRLGYLSTGLDRFVLEGAASASPLRAGRRVAARVGLAGGALFGATFTGAAALLDPARVRAPIDLAVLMAYVTIAAAIATAALAWISGLVAAWVSRGLRRGLVASPTLSRNIGLAVGAMGTVYLGLWWSSHARAAPASVQVVLAAGALGLVLCLTRFGSLAAVAVLSTSGVSEPLPEARRARQHTARLVAASVLLFAAALAAASHLNRAGSSGPDFAVLPTGLTVRVLGIDGFDATLALELAQRGEMPELARRLRAGAHARLLPEPERVPAIVWTTIATGRGPEAHGIRATGARRLAGMTLPVFDTPESRLSRALASTADLLRLTRTEPPSALLRTVKAFWNVASDKGLRVGIVNWWATWPAEAVNGYVLSDRTIFRLERREKFDREVYPSDIEPMLTPLLSESGERARRLDLFYSSAAAQLRSMRHPDLEAVYLPGLDIFTAQQMGSGPEGLAALDSRLSAIRTYYQWLDGRIGEFFGELKTGEVALLVADPGRLERRATTGLVLAVGAPISRGDRGAVSERDVAPTILHLVGLPVSAEMDGHVWLDALIPSFRRDHPVRTVARYGQRRTAPAASGFDREMVEELRSLGYIE